MPNEIAKITGADILHPGRHASRRDPVVDHIGRPPAHLNADERKAWKTFAKELPWLGSSDRTLVEVASRLRARMMTNPEIGVNALAQLRLCLSAMGATPVDRSKISMEDDEDEDPEGYLN